MKTPRTLEPTANPPPTKRGFATGAGRPCTVCAHKDRIRIERELVEGGPMPSLARRYALHDEALARHCKNHMPRAAVVEFERAQAERGSDLLKPPRVCGSKLWTSCARPEQLGI
jgi:hypothetical protein